MIANIQLISELLPILSLIHIFSYVLIAFVAVSLIVSSIMIGIITYISVLERTKEIGILRAVGASKRNISQVFNAETFIVGLCSGVIGIGICLLYTSMESETVDTTVNVHVNRLRKKFEQWPEFEIVAIRGIGYKAVISNVKN